MSPAWLPELCPKFFRADPEKEVLYFELTESPASSIISGMIIQSSMRCLPPLSGGRFSERMFRGAVVRVVDRSVSIDWLPEVEGFQRFFRCGDVFRVFIAWVQWLQLKFYGFYGSLSDVLF